MSQDELIRKVAEQQGIVLSKDDPAIIQQICNEMLLERLESATEAAIVDFTQATLVTHDRLTAETEALFTKRIAASAAVFEETVRNAAAESGKDLRLTLDNYAVQLRSTVQKLHAAIAISSASLVITIIILAAYLVGG